MKKLLLFLLLLPVFADAQTCTPSFTYSVNGNVVTFTNTSDPISTEDEGVRWDFGDGSPHDLSGVNPIIHTYANDGTYLVCLGTFDSSCPDSMYTCQTIVIGGDSTCSASFTYSVSGNQVTFTNTSNPISGEVQGVRWDFGDGSPHDLSGTNPITHIYPQAGTYVVCLGTFDSSCPDSMWVCHTIQIEDDSCYTSFTITNIGGMTYQFTNTSSAQDGDGDDIVWDFGDGNLEYGGDVGTHTYPGFGTYTVCLGTFDYTCNDTSYTCTTLVISPFSVTETDLNTLVSIFPNPGNDLVHVSAEGYMLKEMKLFDASGRMIHTTNADMFDVSLLSPGFYTLQVYLEGGILIQKKFIRE